MGGTPTRHMAHSLPRQQEGLPDEQREGQGLPKALLPALRWSLKLPDMAIPLTHLPINFSQARHW